MKDLTEIYALARARKAGRGALFNQMALVRDAYSGDIAVPLPELSDRETPAVANLLVQGLDQMSERVTSTLPDVFYPSVRPGFDAHDKRADDRRSATLGWWTENRMGLKMRLRARHLLGYSASYVKIEPDADNPIPKWVVRNPLSVLPPDVGTDEITMPDCIFSYTKSAAEVAKTFRLPLGILSKGEQGPATTWEVLEYCDDAETSLILVGPALTGEEALVFSGLGKEVINLEPPIPQRLPNGTIKNIGGTSVTALVRTPNLAGVCPVIAAQRITLGRGMGHFDGMIGQYILQARLMSLESIAVEQAIWPNEWLVSRPNETAEIVRNADGRKGVIGIVNGGEVVNQTFTPGTQTYPTMDRLERAQRLTAGIPSEFGGESVTNVRTGARGSQIMSATIDFPIQEYQDILAASMAAENKVAIAITKAYWGSKRMSFDVRWPWASKGKSVMHADYTPDQTFDSDANQVTFTHSGADINALVVGIGQRVGLGTLSVETAQRLDPLIDDPSSERRLVTVDKLEAALMAGLQQQVQAGAINPADLAALIVKYKEGNENDLAQAALWLQEMAQKRQASSGPPGTETGPAEPGSPEAQPGLAAGTPAQAGAGVPQVGPPNASVSNLSDLVRRLHGAQVAAGTGPSAAPGPPSPPVAQQLAAQGA